MRAARAADYHRRLRERADDWNFKLRSFSFSSIPAIGEAEVFFHSPLNVISDPNGVGKTTLLRAIWACASSEQASADVLTTHKLSAGRAELNCEFANEALTSRVVLVGGKADGRSDLGVEVVHIDGTTQVGKLQAAFGTFSNVEDLINGTGHKSLEGTDLASVKYLARKDYRTVILYEVEIGDSVVPFFEVSSGEDRYDSRTMGAGELSIFYLWWCLQRTQNDAVILIEEPECLLSPYSQAALCDVLTRITVEKHFTIVMTTHSSNIISRLEDENLIFVFRRAQGGG